MKMKHYMKAIRTIQEKEDVERRLKTIKSRAEKRFEMYCYGCCNLTSRWLADGSTLYACRLTPGLVLAISSAFDDDNPMICEKYKLRLSMTKNTRANHHK